MDRRSQKNYIKWDEEARADFVFRAINDLFRFGEGLNPWGFTIDEKFSEWTTKNAYKFITAILFDYTVKKEKLYTVEIPNPNKIGNERNVLMKMDLTKLCCSKFMTMMIIGEIIKLIN